MPIFRISIKGKATQKVQENVASSIHQTLSKDLNDKEGEVIVIVDTPNAIVFGDSASDNTAVVDIQGVLSSKQLPKASADIIKILESQLKIDGEKVVFNAIESDDSALERAFTTFKVHSGKRKSLGGKETSPAKKPKKEPSKKETKEEVPSPVKKAVSKKAPKSPEKSTPQGKANGSPKKSPKQAKEPKAKAKASKGIVRGKRLRTPSSKYDGLYDVE